MTFSNEKVLRSLWRFRVINYQVLAQEYEDISRFPSRNMACKTQYSILRSYLRLLNRADSTFADKYKCQFCLSVRHVVED
jgi:hypothetical protein